MVDFAESLSNSVPTVMRALAQAQNTGILRVRGKDSEAEMMFFQGEVLWARSSTAKRLGEALEERGAISASDLAGVLALQKRKKRRQPLGTILVELGLIERSVAETEIEIQVLRVLRDIFSWGSGEYSFDTLRVEAGVMPDFAIPHCRRVDALLQGVGKPA